MGWGSFFRSVVAAPLKVADVVVDTANDVKDKVGDAGQGVIDLGKDIASSDLGKAAIIATAAAMTDGASLGEAGAAEATGATTSAVSAGNVVETPLGMLDSVAADNAAATAAGAAGAGEAVSGIDLGGPGSSPATMGDAASSGSSAAAGGAAASKVTDAVATEPVVKAAPSLMDGITGKDLLTAGSVATGTAALVNAMTPGIVQQQTTTGTPDKVKDGTEGEKRATADEISNVMAFQTKASQRTRLSGAAVLSKGYGSASTGTKQLLGA